MKLIRNITVIILLLSSYGYASDTDYCDVVFSKTDLGIYQISSSSPTDTIGVIEINCSSALQAVVKFDPGDNSDSLESFFPRRLRQDNYTIDYNLFIDPEHTMVWGDGNNNNTYTKLAESILNVYARIPPKQKVKAGFYTDRVTVTIEW